MRALPQFGQGVAPEVEDLPGGFRDRVGVHLVADQKRERGGQRQLVALGHAVQAVRLAFLVELAAQIGVHAGHVGAAQHLDPGLFQRVIGFARLAGAGRARNMQRVVVMAQAQSDGIRRAAQLGELGRRQQPRRRGQAGAFAADAGSPRLVGNLHIRPARDGAQGVGGGALDVLGPALVVIAVFHCRC